MPFDDLYAALAADREAVDQDGGKPVPQEPDEVVYRLGYSSVPIAGMPDECRIGRVEVYRVVGPVLSQQTLVRQRHGFPIIFDKSMQLGVSVGENELMTVCQTRNSPPAQAGDAISEWREEADSALGILAAALDERVAIEERFEDIVNLREGQPISSADVRMRLRTFLPFDVTDEEKTTLDELANLQVGDLVPLAESARWYLKGAQEGPTADAIIYLWVAIEALTPHRTTSPKTVEAILVSSGFHPDWLGEVSIGRLAGLRADIVHRGMRDHPLIRTGYYRLEAIVRVLIRNAAGIQSSWAPVLNAAVFGENAVKIGESTASRETIWHDGGLPPPDKPQPAGLTWDRVQMQMAGDAPPIDVSYMGDLQPGWTGRADHWLARAAEFLETPFEPIEFTISDTGLGEGVEMAASQTGLLIRPDCFTLPDPVRELTLAQLIQEGLAQVAVMRLGIASVSFGTTLIAAGGSWALYRAFYTPGGPFEGEDLKMRDIEPDDLNGAGMVLGAAVAGSATARQALIALNSTDENQSQLIRTLLNEWESVEKFPQLLAGIEAVANEFKRLSGELSE